DEHMKVGVKVIILFAGLVGWGSCGQTENRSDLEEFEVLDQANWQTGIALYSFNRFSFPETLDMSKRTGVELVEGFFFHKLGETFGNKVMSELSDEELDKLKDMV